MCVQSYLQRPAPGGGAAGPATATQDNDKKRRKQERSTGKSSKKRTKSPTTSSSEEPEGDGTKELSVLSDDDSSVSSSGDDSDKAKKNKKQNQKEKVKKVEAKPKRQRKKPSPTKVAQSKAQKARAKAKPKMKAKSKASDAYAKDADDAPDGDNGGNSNGYEGNGGNGTEDADGNAGNGGNGGVADGDAGKETSRRRWVSVRHPNNAAHVSCFQADFVQLMMKMSAVYNQTITPIAEFPCCCDFHCNWPHLFVYHMQVSRSEHISSSFDSEVTVGTPGRRSSDESQGAQRSRVQPGGLKELTGAEIGALSKDCQINATLHTFMRLFVDETGAPVSLGVCEQHLLDRMRAQGYSNLSIKGIQWFIDKANTYGIIKKLVSKVSSCAIP